jgi:outer membrane receptor protein involved in Fe transport
VSLILQGRYAHRDDREERGITGFLPAGQHAHGGERGFSVDHTELVLSANVDPYWRGYANLAFVDDQVELEEAWFQSLALGRGLTLKGGRFYSGLGYVNEQHPHAWDFADAPLMYQALFGERLSHDGVQLKWLAPTETFLEFGLEAARGQNFPGGGEHGNRMGALTAFAKLGGDVGQSHSWRLGLARLHARPKGRGGHWHDINDDEVHTHFTGRSRAWVADFVWKWAPLGNPKVTNFKFQAEWFRRTESGEMECHEEGSLCDPSVVDFYSSRQSGWYAQGVYQFMPGWRLGARYDRLDSGRMDFGALPLATFDYRPTRTSLMADWSPSEFSRLRLQYARDKSMQGKPEDQWTLQYIMSLGSHGAHKF